MAVIGSRGAGGILAAVILVLVCSLGLIAARILFAMAAYHDARSKLNPDALLWALLIGFLGLIPGVIYLCVRDSAAPAVRCLQCGWVRSGREPFCPRCGYAGMPSAVPGDPAALLFARRAKQEVIAACVVLGSGVLLGLIGAAAVLSCLLTYS